MKRGPPLHPTVPLSREVGVSTTTTTTGGKDGRRRGQKEDDHKDNSADEEAHKNQDRHEHAQLKVAKKRKAKWLQVLTLVMEMVRAMWKVCGLIIERVLDMLDEMTRENDDSLRVITEEEKNMR